MGKTGKRFASFLLTGKAATLPLLPTSALAGTVSDSIFGSSDVHVLEYASDGTVQLLSEFGGAASATDPYGTTAANVLFPAAGCAGTTPTTMNVVVTGLSSRSYVYILASSQKDNTAFLQMYSDLRIGSDFQILSAFEYSGADNGVGVVSVPVNLASIGFGAGETIYLQAAVATINPILGGWGDWRFSELDAVTGVSQSCSYTDGGTSY
ncbi:MAG: hypothetical protein ACOY3Z_11005 [Thermodesulfobacteriota bacterium]